jgi:hypothetical protein
MYCVLWLFDLINLFIRLATSHLWFKNLEMFPKYCPSKHKTWSSLIITLESKHGRKLKLFKGRQWVFIKVLISFRGDNNLSTFRNKIICVDMGQCKCQSTAWTLLGNVKFISHAIYIHLHQTPQLRTDIPILVFGPTKRRICHPMRLADKDSSIQPSQPCYYPNPSGKSTLCKICVHTLQGLLSCSFTTS